MCARVVLTFRAGTIPSL